MTFRVQDRNTGATLSVPEVLAAVNDDRSDEWIPYTEQDLVSNPADVLGWLDREFFIITQEA